MSAVFGGVTILDQVPSSIKLSADQKSVDSISFENKTITCGHYIFEPCYLPDDIPRSENKNFSQKVLILKEESWKELIKDEEKVIETSSSTSDDHVIISTIINGEVVWGTALSASSACVPKGRVLLSLRSSNQS